MLELPELLLRLKCALASVTTHWGKLDKAPLSSYVLRFLSVIAGMGFPGQG